MSSHLSVRGSWPGPVVLRHNWAKAHGRPWNDDLPAANLRLERGTAGFLGECAAWLLAKGAVEVFSSPLLTSHSGVWQRAGFRPKLQLLIYERSVETSPPHPERPIRPGEPSDWEPVRSIDNAAFPPLWRLGRHGLNEAMSATPQTGFLVTGPTGDPDGFAIVGIGAGIAYLQRLAVSPFRQRAGAGTALVRAALQWAAGRGGRTMLLNTQPDNEGAAHLYQKEGFRVGAHRLEVFGWTPG